MEAKKKEKNADFNLEDTIEEREIEDKSIIPLSINQIAEKTHFGSKTSKKLLTTALKNEEFDFQSSLEYLKNRKVLEKFSTGSCSLDGMLRGGIFTGEIIEFYGEYGSGKTQLALQISVNCLLPYVMRYQKSKSEKNLKEKVFFIDTEHTFSPERIFEMTIHETETIANLVLDNIYSIFCFSSSHLDLILEDLQKRLDSGEQIKIIVIDSLVKPFEAEFFGRGQIEEQQHKLKVILSKLNHFAVLYHLAVIITNQVKEVENFFGDPLVPLGGHAIAHLTNKRILLRKSKGDHRIAYLKKSSFIPEQEALFKIETKGIRDI